MINTQYLQKNTYATPALEVMQAHTVKGVAMAIMAIRYLRGIFVNHATAMVMPTPINQTGVTIERGNA